MKSKNLKSTASMMLLLCAVVTALSFNSCKKENPVVTYKDGEIPGLGNTEGDLTGTPFKLPEGVELTGTITGDADNYFYWEFDWGYDGMPSYSFINKKGKVETKSLSPKRADEEIHYFGSGPGYVDLLIPLRNKLTTAITVTFPAATIIRSQDGDCQNGVLLKKVVITIPASSEYKLCLSMYCGNLSKHSAGSSDVYVWAVVSDAKPILDLCDMVKNKKINIEEYDSTSYDEYQIYNSIVNKLQDIVWDITDYYGMDEYSIEEVLALPNSN